ncbi:MAG: hypothetical protein QM689_12570 [Oscillospiraceae bacterium]
MQGCANNIPPHAAAHIAHDAFKAVERFFEQPGTQQKYEAWQKSRSERMKTNAEKQKEAV